MRLGSASRLPRAAGPVLGLAVALAVTVAVVAVVRRRSTASPGVLTAGTPSGQVPPVLVLPRREAPAAAQPDRSAPPPAPVAVPEEAATPVVPTSREVLAQVLAGLQSHL